MQLLISVKNSEEALVALHAGADIIDLKDPNVGALGALNLIDSEKSVRAINGLALVSATVGEGHAALADLLCDIKKRVELGVDIVKIGVSALFFADDFVAEMLKLTQTNIKIVAVFFADAELNLDLLAKLQQAGFYGAMLDTQNKAVSLTNLLLNNHLQHFVQSCAQYALKSGLAGSLKPQDIEFIQRLNPTFIGFRGGVCENDMRQSALSANKITEAKNVLHKHNKTRAKAQESLTLSLHS